MRRQRLDDYLGPYTAGIDVSAYQPKVDWTKVASSILTIAGEPSSAVRFVIVRTGDGIQTRPTSVPDPMAVQHLTGASSAGLAVAVYHYVRGYHPGKTQAEIMLGVIRAAGLDPVGFIVALDVEDGTWWAPEGEQEPTTDQVVRCLAEMTRVLEAAGCVVMVYTGQSWHWKIAQAGVELPTELERLPLWTPYYTSADRPRMPVDRLGGPAPWAEWLIWQAGGSSRFPGSVDGISGVVDANLFRGDDATFRAFWEAAAGRTFDRGEILELAERAKGLGDVEAADALVECHAQLGAC